MKSIKLIVVILIVFFKTGNVLSDQNIFNVNNIEVLKKSNQSNEESANEAIKKGFDELKKKILLQKDTQKIANLNFSDIKQLVLYYQVLENDNDTGEIKYNIFFDKQKLHNLFFKNEIFYSEIINKEIYLLPVLKKNDQYFIFNQNFFYSNWNEVFKTELIEFILPAENIEILQEINFNKNNILSINLNSLFKEYINKNLALIFIEQLEEKENKVFLKTRIQEKNINKNILVKKNKLSNKDYYELIITQVKKEIINIIKSQNLIDVRTPSFINTKLIINKKNNLVELNKRLKNIDLIENIYVQELNNEYVFLKIKYLGSINKIIEQLKTQKISLKLMSDEWRINLI